MTMADSRSHVAVLDIGKTHSKLGLWDASGRCVAHRVRANRALLCDGRRCLDTGGIEAFIAETLASFAATASISCIVPVGHGAAAALVAGDRLLMPPTDYEEDPGAALLQRYRAERDPFAVTGSPAMPLGLNLGAQLYRLVPPGWAWPHGAMILTWPQYWAWRLSGVAATEVTSLGCHSDLWDPARARPSPMAERLGWAERLAPLRPAHERLGPVRREWQTRAGLGEDVHVLCGIHDSNAALLAARTSPGMHPDGALLSTGTWFVAMRPVPNEAAWPALDPARDCLVNVDHEGHPVPSSRFMGGRDLALLVGTGKGAATQPGACLVQHVLDSGAVPLAPVTPGVGPFPKGRGGWPNRPADRDAARTAAILYLAFMSDACLDLIGSGGPVLVEGPAAGEPLFLSALAALRFPCPVAAVESRDAVSLGALRLARPMTPPMPTTDPAVPLPIDLRPHADRWQRECGAA